jgi:allantoin racemase
VLKKSGLEKHCASIALYQTQGDYDMLYEGRENKVFPKMLEACRKAISEDGAQSICLGSTAMYQAGDFLAENLSVPVINPGPLSYRLVETVLAMGHSQSRVTYPKPLVRRDTMIHAMLDAAAVNQE